MTFVWTDEKRFFSFFFMVDKYFVRRLTPCVIIVIQNISVPVLTCLYNCDECHWSAFTQVGNSYEIEIFKWNYFISLGELFTPKYLPIFFKFPDLSKINAVFVYILLKWSNRSILIEVNTFEVHLSITKNYSKICSVQFFKWIHLIQW